MPWRCALDLVTSVRCLRGRLRASSKAKRWMRSTPAAREDRGLGRDFFGQAAVHAAAGAGVLALGVLAHDDPVDLVGILQRRRDARQQRATAARSRTGRSPGRSAAAGPTARRGRARRARRPRRRRWRRRSSARRARRRGCRRRSRGSASSSSRNVSNSSAKPSVAASACRTSMPAGITSLPMPSPGNRGDSIRFHALELTKGEAA